MPEAQLVTAVCGAARALVAVLRDDSGAPLTGYTDAAPLACAAGYGDGRAAAFAPAAEWFDAAAGKVKISWPGSLTLTQQAKLFRLYLSVTGNTGTAVQQVGFLRLLAFPGHSPDAESDVVAYCSFDDVLRYAPWADKLVTADPAMQSDFGEFRSRARTWLDEILIRADATAADSYDYRSKLLPTDPGYGGGAFPITYGYIGAVGTYPNTTLRGYLAGNKLLVRPETVEMTARMAIHYLCETQPLMGGGDSGNSAIDYRAEGVRQWRKADAMVRRYTAELRTSDGTTADVPDYLVRVA